MYRLVDEHREVHGVEPMCRVLQIAPSAYRRHAARLRTPSLQSVRPQRDAALMPSIERVWNDNLQVYGADKVWIQMNREGAAVARCTVERLMRQPERDSSLIHHSDRGSQYVSIRYSERLAEAGVEPSVGSKGDSYDNALAETINGLYKAEVIHRRTWKTREAVELATLTWVSWFNNHRLMGPLGYIPPAEAEANYCRQLAEQSAATA